LALPSRSLGAVLATDRRESRDALVVEEGTDLRRNRSPSEPCFERGFRLGAGIGPLVLSDERGQRVGEVGVELRALGVEVSIELAGRGIEDADIAVEILSDRPREPAREVEESASSLGSRIEIDGRECQRVEEAAHRMLPIRGERGIGQRGAQQWYLQTPEYRLDRIG